MRLSLKQLVGFFSLLTLSCTEKNRKLPILGAEEGINGEKTYHTIPNFEFLNQDSTSFSSKNLEGKIYVADFFFTTCPTICPKMKMQLLRVYDFIENKPDIMLISHSIDPHHDTPKVLKQFASKLGIKRPQWQFLTGDKQKIYTLCKEGYYTSAQENKMEAGGFVHSGAFIMVDKKKHIRGIYDGTKPEEVDKLMQDLTLLLEEYQVAP